MGIWHSQIPTIHIDNDEYHIEGEGSDKASGTTLGQSGPAWVRLLETQIQISVEKKQKQQLEVSVEP